MADRYYYRNEKQAQKAAREIGAMWPGRKFTAHNTGFSCWVVALVHDGRLITSTKLDPLPFTVAASGARVVYEVPAASPGRVHVFPTHRKAANYARKLGVYVSPVPFVGPVQPHVQRRIKYLVERALYF